MGKFYVQNISISNSKLNLLKIYLCRLFDQNIFNHTLIIILVNIHVGIFLEKFSIPKVREKEPNIFEI